jgi:hypothetical protein
MAIIKIEPIDIITSGEIEGTITGLYPISSDFIRGTLTKNGKTWSVGWDKSGFCRDNDSSCNLALNDDGELMELLETAKILGCK